MVVKLIPANYYVYFAVFIANIGAFIGAICITWPSPVLTKLSTLEDNPLGRVISATEQSILGSIPVFGGLIGTFYTGYLTKIYGRKPIILLLAVPTLFAYFIATISTNIWELYAARLLTGLTLGGVFTVNTMYSAEVAEDWNRGLLGTAMNCFINFGLVFTLILGSLTSFFWFHFVLTLLPIGFMTLAYFLLPESPYYLIQKDLKQAEMSLEKLRGTNDVKKELDNIKENLEKEKQLSLKDVLHNVGLRKGLLIGCGLILFQQLSGNAIIMSYGQQIFTEVGGNVPTHVGPIILTGLQFIAGFVTPSVIDRSGRKILLLISHTGITLAHLAFGTYFFLKNKGDTVDSISWLPLVSLIIYIITYSLGSGPIPWSIIGEIFPLEVKEVATSMCIAVCNISAFFMLVAFNFLKESIGIGYIFWIFSGFGVLSVIFVKLYVIETKGKSLNEIQETLNF